MIIPAKLKSAISSFFYDKTFTRYSLIDSVNDEGEVIEGQPVENGSFKGNPSFDNFEWVMRAFGVKTDIDMTVSTHSPETNGTIISYDGQQYEAYKVFPFDSHYLLVCREWSSKSSTLTSV